MPSVTPHRVLRSTSLRTVLRKRSAPVDFACEEGQAINFRNEEQPLRRPVRCFDAEHCYLCSDHEKPRHDAGVLLAPSMFAARARRRANLCGGLMLYKAATAGSGLMQHPRGRRERCSIGRETR